MNYKKFLKRPKAGSGQASLEYFILLAVIGTLTLIMGNSFLNNARTSRDGLYSESVNRILNP